MTKHLCVQLAKVVSLLTERAVAATENGLQDTVKVLASGNPHQSILQLVVSGSEAGDNLRVILRAASNVVRRIVGIDNGESNRVLVREVSDIILVGIDGVSSYASTVQLGLTMTTYLVDVTWGVQPKRGRCVVEPVAIEIKEVHKQRTQVVLWDHAAALDSGHHLKHADNHADDGESANATVDRLVETAHRKVLLDERDENGHGRVLLPPGLECANGNETANVLEGDVHPQTGRIVDVLGDGNLGLENSVDIAPESDIASSQHANKVPLLPSAQGSGRSTVDISLRTVGQIHVRGGQVEARHVRSEWEHFAITYAGGLGDGLVEVRY